MSGILSGGLYDGRSELVDDALALNANYVMVFNDGLRHAATIKQRSPRTKIVGRPWWGTTAEQMSVIYDANARQITYDRMKGLIQAFPDVDYWQAFNEVFDAIAKDFTTLRLQMEAERGAADACRELGKGLLAFSGGPGTTPTKRPDDTARDNWEPWCALVVPMFSYPGVAGLSMHAYGADKDGVPLRFWDGADWYMCRYKLLIEGLIADGVKPPATWITETGYGGPWRQFYAEQQVIEDYTWYGLELLKCPQIESIFHFTIGDSGGWSEYDLHGTSIISAFGDFNAAHPVDAPLPEPEVPTVFEWKLAFANYAAAHLEVGQPITDIMYDNQGNAWQYSDRGLLLSAKGLGWQIFWLPNAQNPN